MELVRKEDSPMKEDKNVFHKIKKSFQDKKFKNGAYSSIVMVVILIAVVFVNLIFAQLDLKYDVSADEMYTITDQTKTITDGLDEDITIYYVVQEGNEISQVEEILNKYKNLSHIKVVKKDPVVYPNFTSQYTDSTETVEDNSIIVVNEEGGRYKFVPYSDLLIQELDYTTYSYTTTAIDVEGQITSAIQYVTSEDLPKMYTTTGHGETELTTTMAAAVGKQNVETESLDTLTKESIPDDCDILLINAPTSDLSEDEASMIKTYIQGGGKAIFFTTYTTDEMTNYYGLLKYYGIAVSDGIIVEDSNHSVGGYLTYTLSEVQSCDITDGIDGSILLVGAQGLGKVDTRSSVTLTPILQTSDNAYAKIDLDSTTADKEEGDIDGPFYTGILATETYDDVTSEIVVYSTPNMLEDLNVGSVQNEELFMNTINYLADMDTGLSIPTRSVATTYLTVTQAQSTFWTVALVIMLPATLVIIGFVNWFKRRRR